MRNYENSVDEYDEDFEGDKDSAKRPRRFIGIVLVAFGLVATTLAANLSLNNGRIEMGQGVYRITACDQWVGIGLNPTAAIYGGKSRVESIDLIGLDPRLCKDVVFRIKLFKNTDPNTPLGIFTGVVGTDTATATTETGTVSSLTIYDTATVSYPTTTYNYYAARALTLINGAGVNIGYRDDYHRIQYASATGVYGIIFYNPLALMEDVDKITIESSKLPT
ncbi:hypothetical protein MCEMRE26_00954 [Candidatus Nanopelagicaceae bacterium]